MNHLTNNEIFELRKYVTNQLTDIPHIVIDLIEVTNDNNTLWINFGETQVFLNRPHFSYKIFIFKNQGLYYIQYAEYYYVSFPGRPIITTQLYEIEDIDDVFNVLEDIFDTLRPRDEYYI